MPTKAKEPVRPRKIISKYRVVLEFSEEEDGDRQTSYYQGWYSTRGRAITAAKKDLRQEYPDASDITLIRTTKMRDRETDL